MKVPISGRIDPKNRKNVEEKANKLERTISDTLDRILSEYFSLEKNKETATV